MACLDALVACAQAGHAPGVLALLDLLLPELLKLGSSHATAAAAAARESFGLSDAGGDAAGAEGGGGSRGGFAGSTAGFGGGHMFQEAVEARLALLAAAAWRPAAGASASTRAAAGTAPGAASMAAVVSASGTQVPLADVAEADASQLPGGPSEAEAGASEQDSAPLPLVAAQLLSYCWGMVFEARGGYQVLFCV